MKSQSNTWRKLFDLAVGIILFSAVLSNSIKYHLYLNLLLIIVLDQELLDGRVRF